MTLPEISNRVIPRAVRYQMDYDMITTRTGRMAFGRCPACLVLHVIRWRKKTCMCGQQLTSWPLAKRYPELASRPWPVMFWPWARWRARRNYRKLGDPFLGPVWMAVGIYMTRSSSVVTGLAFLVAGACYTVFSYGLLLVVKLHDLRDHHDPT